MNDYHKLSDEELSGLVAEKVMGWTDVHYDGPLDRVRYRWMGIPPDDRTWHEEINSYASDIAAAMQVVEKLMEQGTVVILKGDGLRIGKSPRWTVLCGSQPRFDNESLPRAICIAALQTL